MTNTKEGFEKVSQAIDATVGLLRNLFDPADGSLVYVPDTNALIYNPQIEAWEFPDVAQFSLALTPTVLGELDSLKINHRVEDVRNKAESLIRRIKEYRRRGDLNVGVPVVKNVIKLIAIAKEPSLGWLDNRRRVT